MSDKIEALPIVNDSNAARTPTMEEMLPKLTFKPAALIWNNWHQGPPEQDRWVILFVNLGKVANNLIMTYRDAQGNWDLPSGKNYQPLAWAYIGAPDVDQEAAKASHAELVASYKKDASGVEIGV